ncbi:MAG: citrate transporter [Elusimicrobia bacterium]|nr:citrate transporter [Elusimicrobiota bacterium]
MKASLDSLAEEWLLLAAAAGLLLTSVRVGRLPRPTRPELEVVFLLFALFVAVKGLENCGLVARFSRALERGRAIPLKLTLAAFFLSMLLTNDAALIVLVPLTLALDVERRDLLVILEALAANAGSALTPFGNPQNLFLYWYYRIAPLRFLAAMAEFSLPYLILLIPAALVLVPERAVPAAPAPEPERAQPRAYVYGMLLGLAALAVLRVLPVAAAGAVFVYALAFDRRSLRVDYALLLTFLCFFGFADNVRHLLASGPQRAGSVFLASALASQFISNVPAALLFAKLTTRWNALLWGANVGGFGSLAGSLANLIAYKLYVAGKSPKARAAFTARFLGIGYAAFLFGIALYFAVGRTV